MANLWGQVFPPTAELTETNLPDQAGKVMSYCAIIGRAYNNS
jgi:hypothetical protein